MYFKETQQDQASYPYATYRSSSRTPILPDGYYGDDVMMGAGNVMETIKGYFTNKWVMLIAALLIIGLLMFFLMKKSSSVESYHY